MQRVRAFHWRNAVIQFRFHHYYAMDSWDGEQKKEGYNAVTSSPPSFVKRVVTFTGQTAYPPFMKFNGIGVRVRDCELKKGEMEEGEGRGTKGKEGARSGIGGNAGGARGEEVTEPTVALESPSWLEGCYVGSLKVVSCMRALKECFVLGGFSHVGIRQLGESYVLLSCDEGEGLSKILTENKAWFDEMFLTVAPWDESFAVKERSMWLRCERHPASNVVRSVLFGVGELVGEVVEIDEATKKKEKLEYVRIRVKIPFNSVVKVAKVLGINGVSCTVSFEEEASFRIFSTRRLAVIGMEEARRWIREASSEEGSVGTSLGVSAESEFEAVGGGEVGDEGGGGTEVYDGGDDVRGGRVSSTIGRVRKQGEGVPFQDALSGALMENDFLGAKVGSVSSPLMGDACIPNKSKATSDWGRRSIDEGSSCIGRGSLKVLEGVNGVGAEICNVSGKDFGWDSYVEVGPRHALIKEVGGKVLEGCKDADYVEVGPRRTLIKEVGGKELEGCKDADTEALAKAFCWNIWEVRVGLENQ
ncbi:hypothetical protein ACSQ67_018083 [Phaseolus vulgaris]